MKAQLTALALILASTGHSAFAQTNPKYEFRQPMKGVAIVELAPGFTATPTAVSFGTVTVGTQSTQTVVIKNNGNAPLTLSGIQAANPFSVTNSTCMSSLAPNAECSVSIGFSPTTGGEASGVLQVNTNLTPAVKEVALSGSGSLVTIQTDGGGVRSWSNGTTAASCKDYRTPAAGFQYSGSTGNGTYRITVDGQQYNVFCDMTTDGGGWTLVAKNSNSGAALSTFTNNQGSLIGNLSVVDGAAARLPYARINTLFRLGGIAMYKVDNVPYVYYKRVTNLATHDFATAFFIWSNPNAGNLNTDFRLYSTFSHLQADTNRWMFCNYDFDVSFPRDCGPTGFIGNKWFSYLHAAPSGARSLWVRH